MSFCDHLLSFLSATHLLTMPTKHTLGTDLEKHLPNEDSANDISPAVIDEFDSLQDQRLLRKVDLRWHFNPPSYLVSADSHLPRLLPILTLLYLLSFLDRFVYFFFSFIRIHLPIF